MGGREEIDRAILRRDFLGWEKDETRGDGSILGKVEREGSGE